MAFGGLDAYVRYQLPAGQSPGVCYLMIARTKLNAVQCHYEAITFRRNQVDFHLIIILKVGSVHG